MRAALLALAASLAACGMKGPPRAPGVEAPPQELVEPEPCADCPPDEPAPAGSEPPSPPPPAPAGDGR